jgi:hypothetical protein
MQIHEARPPFVEFKQIAKHDPKRSEELGYRVTKNVDMAFIMQPGSRDQVEIEAQAWLDSLKRKLLDAAPDAYPPQWVEGFQQKYNYWKQGQEAPVDGTSVREWPVLSPAEVENLIAVRVLTVEDVAAMTEEAMGRVGMGARNLREKAREWIKGKDIAGSALKENEELKQQIAAMQDQLNQLLASNVTPMKRGRKAAA